MKRSVSRSQTQDSPLHIYGILPPTDNECPKNNLSKLHDAPKSFKTRRILTRANT